MRELAFVWREMLTEKRDILLSILFGFIAGITAVALFASSGYLISKAALSLPVFALAILTAVVKFFGLARAAGRYFERIYSHRATFSILSNMRVSFYKKLEPIAAGLSQRYRSGDLLGRIVGDIDRLQHFYLRVFYPPIVFILIFLVTIWFTLFYSFEIALLMLLGVIFTGIVIPGYFAWSIRKKDRKVRSSRGEFAADSAEFFAGYRDLKIMSEVEGKKSDLRTKSNDYGIAQSKEGKEEVLHQAVNSFVSLFVTWSVIGVGSYLVTTGELDGVFLAMLVLISLTSFENAVPLAIMPAYLQDSIVASKRLSSVEGKPWVEEKEKLDLPKKKAFSLSARNVTFSYPKEIRKSLTNVTVHIPAGGKTAIVGPSGSGKSTLLQLFLKFFEGSGTLEMNDRSIQSLSEENIWSETNVVLQQNHFFSGTIRDNLLLAGESLSDEKLMKSLQAVQLEHFSLDYSVHEKGSNLSGGEQQRLAIARSFLKGKRVWLLDEPTSSVDLLTERSILKHLFEQAKEDTLLLVSHRLNNLEQMDQIIVMDSGQIVESGTYKELMKMKGYFYQMREIEKSVLL
ncbi:thiol reductant ABC exporter subunit CydC [Pseudalkalibacillus sp. JSM 102089]|uniref:thiol reductant ABC exporter subunit CydC n=1 Tax=Pseudalkalibacillus sp. JSM 102089 TaxID=3229856 RepID=UPI00352499F0